MKKIILPLVCLLIFTAAVSFAEPVTFYDLNNHSWAVASVCRLAEKDIIKGTAPHYFSPENYVSKGQVATLLCRMFEIGGEGLSAYLDVDTNQYYYRDIAALRALGILEADENGNFHPEDPATREFTMRVTGFLLMRFEFADYADTGVLGGFADGGMIAPENREYVATLIEKGFIKGDAMGRLCPADYLTRAEVAVMLDRMYLSIINE